MSNAEKIKSKLSSLSTGTLKEMVAALANDFRDGAGTVLEFVLAELEQRVSSDEFVAICDAA